MEVKEKKTGRLFKPFIIIFIIGAVFVLLLSKLPQIKKQSLPGKGSSNIIQKPAPRQLDQGKQTYNVSRGSDMKGPAISQVIFDPFDPKVGETQVIDLKIKNASPVKKVSVTLKSDNKSDKFDFKLKDGTDTEGTWETSVKTTDTHDYTYTFMFLAADNTDTYTLDYPFR